MDSFFLNPEVQLLPPQVTRILDLKASQSPDGSRLHVRLELTPFHRRPDIDLTLVDSVGQVCATTTIIEPVGWKLDVTLHLRSTRNKGSRGSADERSYNLMAVLSYPDLGQVDHHNLSLEISPAIE